MTATNRHRNLPESSGKGARDDAVAAHLVEKSVACVRQSILQKTRLILGPYRRGPAKGPPDEIIGVVRVARQR